MALTDSAKAQRLESLTRLALATREKVTRDVYVLYLEDTADFSTDVVLSACRRLEHSASWFPKVAELRAECLAVARQKAEQLAQKRLNLLTEPQVSPEKLAKFKAAVQALINRKGMS